MAIILGFVIALLTGLTGVGGGSFTTPALVLLFAMPAAESVGTALIFSAVLKLFAVPLLLVERQVNSRVLKLMLAGGVPGLLIGSFVLRTVNSTAWKPYVLAAVGSAIVLSAVLSIFRAASAPRAVVERNRWLPWLSLPIGIETGFSSAGAGALGTLVLFNYSALPAAQVVGTDLIFAFVISALGAAFHLSWGSFSSPVLQQLLAGGIPGILVGVLLSRRVPARQLRTAVLALGAIIGVHLTIIGIRAIPFAALIAFLTR
jgi:uncharacterized membrane protein YfcA